MPKTTATLDAGDLLHGAFYALEQGGRLLHDAVSLWNQQRYSSAVVLAVFAREEIGRFKILLQERDEALKSGPRGIEEVRKLVNDHKEKLRTAPAGISLHFDASAPGLEGLHAHPQSPEFQKAHALLDERMRQKAERQPKTTHLTRMSALYVDIDEGTKTWKRPGEITPGAAGLLLQEIANDYSHRYSYLANPNDYYREPFEAFLAWDARPTLPEPVSPDLSQVALPLEG
jgi:AbiV family abortive infection protein